MTDLTYSGCTLKVHPVLKASASLEQVPKLKEEAGEGTQKIGNVSLITNTNKAGVNLCMCMMHEMFLVMNIQVLVV